ncbi:hypothetical protein RchiOBHm_Chr3g0477351 [Rosa chinensis]|uniref:Uncharacterized protein n=1 Tax=Rosa chinensis TaxID=74649 RepID=A0A2P6RCW8_ROSCH|nr:hypothetical protein RchiOBHm_Chr3g0477351 [Rosa chinensis]
MHIPKTLSQTHMCIGAFHILALRDTGAVNRAPHVTFLKPYFPRGDSKLLSPTTRMR